MYNTPSTMCTQASGAKWCPGHTGPANVDDYFNPDAYGYHGGDTDGGDGDAVQLTTRPCRAVEATPSTYLGVRVGIIYAKDISPEERAEAALRLGNAADLLNTIVSNLSTGDRNAIEAVRKVKVTNDPEAYLGTEKRGQMLLNVQYMRHSSDKWLGFRRRATKADIR